MRLARGDPRGLLGIILDLERPLAACAYWLLQQQFDRGV
jgi:hypothetical protein